MAIERARAEGTVVLLAVNMDVEAGNERMAKKLSYRDKRIQALAAEAVSVITSTAAVIEDGEVAEHAGGVAS